MDLSNLNLQPALDMLSKAGELTTEYKTARTAGRVAILLFALSVLSMAAGLLSNVFGASSKVGIAAGAAGAIAAVISKSIISTGYSSARADTKAAAATVLAQAAPITVTTPTGTAAST